MEEKKGRDTLSRFFRNVVLILAAWWLINNVKVLGAVLSKVANILLPFIIGGAIAFIINIPMTFFEKHMSWIKLKVIRRIISIILSIAIVSLIIYLIINLIVPELGAIINMLITNIPYYITEVKELAVKWDLTEYIEKLNLDETSLKAQILSIASNVFTSSISLVSSVFGVVSTAIISIIFAIYVLASKEKIAETLKTLLNVYAPKKAKKIIDLGSLTNVSFKSFFTVQCLEAIILGVLCYIGMLILKIPYAIPISVLISVTALVPIVGGIVGIIIGAILIVAVEPTKALPFIIFMVVLQQFEGNVIYPKVVGESLGLPGILVLVAVTLGGNMFGVLGMLLSVPTAVVIYTLVKNDIKDKTKKDNKKEIKETKPKKEIKKA
ncbi:MAG: AI-2E family transporter [Clostridia bacterium]|nr:AI-2E family transporter [Clostridia bacterium]